jgi:hypothetical protein
MPYRYRISIRGNGEGEFFGDRGDSAGTVTEVMRTKADDGLVLNGIWIEPPAKPQGSGVVLHVWKEILA